MTTVRTRTLALLGAAGVALSASAALAGTYTLVDGNSTAGFDTNQLSPNSRVGMTSWVVDGVNHMYSQWFWFRTDGMTQEDRINALPFLAGGTSDVDFSGQAETLFLRYGNLNTFTIETSFILQGGSANSNQSSITEQIRISNIGGGTRTFSFFQYCDFDLGSDVQDDGVGVINANTVNQYDFSAGIYAAETVITPTFSLAEVNIYPLTLGSLDDNAITTLNGNLGPLVGRADYTWAFQWNFTLLEGQTLLISKGKIITPTPGAMALLGLGGLIAARRRRA